MQLNATENETAMTGYLNQLSPESMELFSMLGLMGWPLVICAILIFAIMLERFGFFLRKAFTSNTVFKELGAIIEAHKGCEKHLRDEIVSAALSDVQHSFLSGIRLLRTISVISPMLGLLGTILGIISAFKVIAAQKGPVSPSLIADGLWEAMLTTAVGLMIALPAIMAAYIFKYLAERYLHDLTLKLNRLSMKFALEQSLSHNLSKENSEQAQSKDKAA